MTNDNKTDLAGLIATVGGNSTVELQAGTCVFRDGAWRVSRGGLELDNLVWLESASPRTGACLLAIDTANKGQSVVYVLGFTHATNRREYDIALVTTNSSFGRCNLQFPDGKTYEGARNMAHYIPAINEQCLVLWRGGEAYVIGGFQFGHAAAAAVKPPAIPELPRGLVGGNSEFPSTRTRVWSNTAGDWKPAASRDIRVTPNDEVVFVYSGATKGLVDKGTVESATFTLGKRSQVGNTEDVVVSLYRSDAETLAGGHPNLLDGPYSVTIPKHYQGAPLPLPAELAESLKLGGSITLKTPSDLAFTDSPASGHLNIKWKKV